MGENGGGRKLPALGSAGLDRGWENRKKEAEENRSFSSINHPPGCSLACFANTSSNSPFFPSHAMQSVGLSFLSFSQFLVEQIAPPKTRESR